MNAHRLFSLRPNLPRPSISEMALWITGAVPLAFLALLIAAVATITPARASDIACHGENLLVTMEKEKPEELAKIRAEAAKVPNGKGIFWKVEKEGLKPSYLLGTMHVTDPRVLTMPNGAREAAAAADVVVIESDEILDEQKAASRDSDRPSRAKSWVSWPCRNLAASSPWARMRPR